MLGDLFSQADVHLPPAAGALGEGSSSAINCTSPLPPAVADYVRHSLAENTRRAYLADLAHFAAWGGRLPSRPNTVAEYLTDHAGALKTATLVRRLASISKAHRLMGVPSPTGSELVRATLRGIQRREGASQNQAKPFLKDDLFQVLDTMGTGLKDLRDRALLLIGFAGAFRRSELVGLELADLEFVRQGLVVHLRRCKTDQTGRGRKVAIPLARGRWCPVGALEAWISQAEITQGAVFRRIDRHRNIGNRGLTGEAVSLVLRSRLQSAGLRSAGYSGHSLRAGLATSAAQARVSPWKIRQQTGHASEAMLARYIRDGELFADNAAGAVL
jgi:integrase